MTIIFLLVYFWGLFQLLIISTPTRTIRWRTLVLAFLSGVYLTPLIAVVLEQLWIRRLVAQSSDWFLIPSFFTQQSGYTVSPFIEELVKLLPLLLILSWKKVRDRSGVTDILLLGAALGAGFGFAEITPRIRHFAENLSWWSGPGGGEWMISMGLSTKTIPGVKQILTSFLPGPLQTGILFDTRYANFAGTRIDVVDYNHHLAWSVFAALGVGLFVRSPKKHWTWPALLLPLWSSAIHAFENFTLGIFPDANPTWVSIMTGSAAAAGFGRWINILILICFLIAILLDRRLIRRGISDEKELGWSGDKPSDSPSLPGGLGLVPFFRLYGYKGARSVKNYLLERRAFSLSKDILSKTSQLAGWREQLKAKREFLESTQKVRALRSIEEGLLKHFRSSRRYRTLIAVRIMIGVLFLLPALLYLVVGIFPNTHHVLDLFTSQTAFTLLSGLGVLSGLMLLARITLFYHGLPTARRSLSGQELGGYLLGGIVAHGALLLLAAGLALGFLGGPAVTAADLLHISENLPFVLFVDLGMLVLALIGLFFPVPAGFLLYFLILNLILALDTVWLLSEKGPDNLNQLERLEYQLALADILLFPVSFVSILYSPTGPFWTLYEAVDGYMDVPSASLGVALDAIPEQPGPVDWSRPGEIRGAFNQIRRGDRYFLDQRFQEAQRAYEKAWDLMERGSTTPISKLVLDERLGDSLANQGNHQGALKAYQQAVHQTPSARMNPKYQANLLVKIGDQQTALSDLEAAQASYQQALDLLQASDGDPIRIAEILLKLSEIWRQLGEQERALQTLQQTFDLLLQGTSPSPERADLWASLGEEYLNLADLESATHCLQHSAEEFQALGQPQSERLLELLEQLD